MMSPKGANVPTVRIRTKQNWAEIRAITVSNELMFIETTEGVEIMHCFSDTLRWLSYSDPQQVEQVNSDQHAMQR